jgi:hypothetical protein
MNEMVRSATLGGRAEVLVSNTLGALSPMHDNGVIYITLAVG